MWSMLSADTILQTSHHVIEDIFQSVQDDVISVTLHHIISDRKTLWKENNIPDYDSTKLRET